MDDLDYLHSLVDNTAPEMFKVNLLNEKINLKSYIENIEIKIINQALEITNQNKNQAAKLLGLNRTTLIEKLKKFNKSTSQTF
ncbi:MAG: helix-turn-helix domain-containing protein [Bacteriovoracaceae bacterium]